MMGSTEHPIGRISKSTCLESREDIDLIPILLWVRPLAPLCFGIDLEGCRVLPEPGDLKDRQCLVLEQTRGVTDRWYIDAAADWTILRYEVLARGKAKVRIDLDYTSAEKGGRLLRGWQTRVWSGATDQATTVAIGVVTSQAVGEQPPAKDFELIYPRGTWLHDEVRGQQYVIEGDGSRRLVTEEEIARGAASKARPKAEPVEER
jgi:hypothetical protein